MRKGLAVLAIVVSASSACMLASPAAAQLSFGFSTPGVSIGVNLGAYPHLVRIPGYPVYYAPSLDTNYFFYDGMYWVFDGDNWYASTWYNGPWEIVPPDDVPLFLLRVPVRYYVAAPTYFRSWAVSGPPRWGHHWGRGWEERHRDWDRWNRSAIPSPAPLPTYQRQYAGNRYPSFSEQRALESRNYTYRPHDRVVQQAFTARARSYEGAPQGQVAAPQERIRQGSEAQPARQAQTREQDQARARHQQGERVQRAETQQAQPQRSEQQRAQQAQRSEQQRAQQAQAQRSEQAQRAQEAQRFEQAQRAQQAQAQRAQQTQAQRAEQAQRGQQQAQAQRAEQAQRGQQQAQAQRAQQAQAQREQQAQAQREQQNGGHGRGNERRDEHNG